MIVYCSGFTQNHVGQTSLLAHPEPFPHLFAENLSG